MNPRDDMPAEVREAAAQAFRGHKTTYDAGLITGTGHVGQVLADVHYTQPYGVRSNPPADQELVYLKTTAGLIVVTQREDATDYANLGLSEPEDGETILYNAQGCLVHLDKNGDIIHEPKAGRHIKLGSGATEFVAMANKVSARLDALQSAHDTHKHATAGLGAPSIPDTLVGELDPVAATKAKVE